MKKLSREKSAYLRRRDQARRNKEAVRASVRSKKKAERVRRMAQNLNAPSEISGIDLIKRHRRAFQRRFYKKRPYAGHKQTVVIEGQCGLEHDSRGYAALASEFISSNARGINFNISDCTKMWPSAIALLCSFKQWTEITAKPPKTPAISSSESKHGSVNQYLAHSGFYDYVNRPYVESTEDTHVEAQNVKIQRETDLTSVIDRENSIHDIIRKYSSLTADQIEKFGDVVLSEVFSNVTEHGISFRDKGWWTITQYHDAAGIISFCLADNGIGIKHSLLTGPQKKDLQTRIKGDQDGDYIRHALEANVSGALTGSIRDERELLVLKKYPLGKRRGNGLKRVVDTCRDCGISLRILSQKGFLCMDTDGEISHNTHAKRVFAGTLYHFIVPAKRQS